MNNWSNLDGRALLVEFDAAALPNQSTSCLTREGIGFAAPALPQTGWDWLRGGGFFIAQNSGSTVFSYVATGGVLAGGATLTSKANNTVATGGMVATGAATTAKAKSYLATGGIVSSGFAPLTLAKAYLASGGISAAGLASYAKQYAGAQAFSYLATGGAVASGAATYRNFLAAPPAQNGYKLSSDAPALSIIPSNRFAHQLVAPRSISALSIKSRQTKLFGKALTIVLIAQSQKIKLFGKSP